MIRVLHLADVHLGASYSGFGELAGARRAEVLERFQLLPEVAGEEGVHAVVVAGDLFDGPRASRETVASAREALRGVVESGRSVFLVPGNHDSLFLARSPYREGMGGAHTFLEPRFGDPVTAETPQGPLQVYGLAYDGAREPDPLTGFRRAQREGVHLVLLHGSVPDAPHWRPSPNCLQLPPDKLAGIDADYFALGDYHRFRAPLDFGGAPCCYPGSFAALDLTETGPRGYVLVDLEPGAAPKVRHLSSGVTPVEEVGEVDVSGCASEVEAAARVAGRIDGNAIPVGVLTGEPAVPLDPEGVLAELKARFGHALVRDQLRYHDSARLDELAEEDTVVGHLVRIGRRRIEEAEDEDNREVARRALHIALAALEVR
ncbi:MAG: metallophosphoesterase family protein [Longimicrobiaceae bacterium]